MNTSRVTPLQVVLVGVLALLVSACTTPPDPLPRLEVPADHSVDPAQPCSHEPATGPPNASSDPSDIDVRVDRATNTIMLTGGENVSIPELAEEVNDSLLHEVEPGTWMLDAGITVLPGASLRISAPDVRWLRMASAAAPVTAINVFGGGLSIAGSCITSWNEDVQKVDEQYKDGRSYLLARDGATMTIDDAELRFLGSGDVESYGLSWRTEGTTGHIRNSVISHLYYGLYSYEVVGLEVTDNEFHDNVLYGVDPHTHSRNLVIERNVVHDNGKHGIILAEECTDSVIRDNIVYDNKHHGIVLYQDSDNNLIEGNESFRNAAQGININDSNGSTIRNNKVYDNNESGVGLTQTSRDNLIEGNELRGNKKDGLRLVSESAATTARANTIGRNGRYGIYIDTTSGFDLTKNVIFGNRIGMVVRGDPIDKGDNEVFDNTEGGMLAR